MLTSSWPSRSRLDLHLVEFVAPCARRWEKQHASYAAQGITLHVGDQSSAADLERVYAEAGGAPFDLIIDDGSHRFLDQQATLHVLWPRVRPGGFYIVEDVLVGALPWDAGHAKQVPTSNANCRTAGCRENPPKRSINV